MDTREALERLQELTRKYLGAVKVNANQAGSAVGSPGQGMQKRFRELIRICFADAEPHNQLDGDRLTVMDVGDLTVRGSQDGYDVTLSLPVASDIWYLGVGESVLPFRGDNYQENAAMILGFLAAYLVRLDNIKPLKSIQSYADIHAYMDWTSFRQFFDTEAAPRVIRTARFETWMLNRSTEFPSKGPKASIEAGVRSNPSTSLGNLYCGLLSFPVGMMGVMEMLSLFSESMDDMLKNNVPFAPDIQIENPEGWRCVTEKSLDGLMSPPTDMKGICPGVHLLEKGYVIESRNAEYPAPEFPGYDKLHPFQSFRYYLRRDAKWPIPGEFIGLLAKPWPSHAWWFQETSPLLYAGSWVETNYYTSGIITEIKQPPEGSYGLVYKCVVRGVELYIAASDFFGFAVGDRVAIIRINDLGRFTDPVKGNFKWKEMEDLIARKKLESETPSNLPYVTHPGMMIVPMSFYQ
jgi:hypothetical protein